MHSDYLSKLAISWLLYRDDVSPCPRVHQVGFRLLYLVKPKLTAGLVWVLLDLTKGLGFVLMWVNLVWFIAGLSKKINGGPFESKSLIALCTYVSSLWVFSPSFSFPACLPPGLFSPRLFFHLVSGTWRSGVSVVFCCYTGWIFLLSLAVHHPQLKLKPSFASAGPDGSSLRILQSTCTCPHIPMPAKSRMNTSIIILKHGHLFLFSYCHFQEYLAIRLVSSFKQHLSLSHHFIRREINVSFRIVKFIGGAVAKGVRLAKFT